VFELLNWFRDGVGIGIAVEIVVRLLLPLLPVSVQSLDFIFDVVHGFSLVSSAQSCMEKWQY
jgi:hypothetical protein